MIHREREGERERDIVIQSSNQLDCHRLCAAHIQVYKGCMGYSVQREEPASSIVKIKKKKESKKEKESGILYRKVGRRCGCGIHFIPDTSLLPLLCFYSFFFFYDLHV